MSSLSSEVYSMAPLQLGAVGGARPADGKLWIVPRIAIGIGAVIAAIAGLGWASSVPVSVSVLFLGVFLVAHGTYDVYYKPNVRLDRTVKRWLERHYWTVNPESNVPADKFYFAIWARDPSDRRIMISREKATKGILGFAAPIDLDDDTVRKLGDRLSAVEQQKIYEELHILLASMHLGYNSEILTNMAVEHALPIDERLSEHTVDLKAKEVVDGVIAARSTVRKAVL